MAWYERWLGGHFSFTLFGVYVVVFGFNAMHVAVDICLPWRRTCVCFHPPLWCFGFYWPWKLYVSPNATPWGAMWGIGPGISREDKERIKERQQKARIVPT